MSVVNFSKRPDGFALDLCRASHAGIPAANQTSDEKLIQEINDFRREEHQMNGKCLTGSARFPHRNLASSPVFKGRLGGSCSEEEEKRNKTEFMSR